MDDEDFMTLCGVRFDGGQIAAEEEKEEEKKGENDADGNLLRHFDHAGAVAWLHALPADVAVRWEAAAADPTVDGAVLLRCLSSVREMRDLLGLETAAQRLAFEAAARAADGDENRAADGSGGGADNYSGVGIDCSSNASRNSGSSRSGSGSMNGGGSGTAGRLYSPEFLRVVAPLHDPHMGCENQAPLLYALVRYLKPATIIEVGGGYTTVFLLQALEDNAAELRRCRGRSAVGEGCVDGGTPMYVGAELLRPDRGLLHCIDNMAHRFTTAPLVLEAAETLSLEHRLRLVVGDAWKMVPQLDADLVIDFLWLDFGAGAKLDTFLELLWDRINPRGGYIAVHSTLTNTLTRSWLEGMRQRTRGGGDDRGGSGGDGCASGSSDDRCGGGGGDGGGGNAGFPDGCDAGATGAAEAAAKSAILEEEGARSADREGAPAASGREPEQKDDIRGLGEFETLSFLEPHKLLQNSFSLFQKRGRGWTEPLLTKYP